MNAASGSRFAATLHTDSSEPGAVVLAPHGLAVERNSGELLWWPFEQIRVERHEPRTRILHSGGAWAEVTDPDFFFSLRQLNPAVARGEAHNPASSFWWKIAALAAALLALAAMVFAWGVPWLGEWMAEFVPAPVEVEIGRATLAAMAPPGKTCHDPTLDRIADRLIRAAPSSDYRFRIVVIEQPEVNAFAAPGGFIAVYRGLLDKTHHPEQAAAVLAHEIQHVLQRHSLRGMMRNASLWIALSLLIGAPGDATTQLAATLGSLHYQRDDEASADREGIELLRAAGVDPRSMAAMLKLLDAEQASQPAAARYFSTHPLPADRIREAHQLAGAAAGYPRLLPGVPWPPSPDACVPAPAGLP